MLVFGSALLSPTVSCEIRCTQRMKSIALCVLIHHIMAFLVCRCLLFIYLRVCAKNVMLISLKKYSIFVQHDSVLFVCFRDRVS